MHRLQVLHSGLPLWRPAVRRGQGRDREVRYVRRIALLRGGTGLCGICPQRALKVGDIDELRAEFGDCADVAPLPSSADTAPNVVIVAHRNAKTNLADVRILSLEQ